jgi:hypothetical protein
MSQVKDPVCGMMIGTEDAARYYDRLERQEAPYTVTEGMAAPKFGSAGSGGLENEPVGRRQGGR